MKGSIKTKAGVLAIGGIILASTLTPSMSAFADGSDSGTLDVTVTNKIDFSLPVKDSNDATVSDIQVTNNSSTASVLVSNIRASAATGYTLESFNSAFNTFSADSRHFGIAYNATSGASDISGSGLTTEESIDISGSKTFSFVGKSSIYSTAIATSNNIHMANITLTMEAVIPPCETGGTLYGTIACKTNGEDSNIDFATAPSAANGNGVNTVSSTANDENPVYYFRGAVSDNNVLFANFCWKAVRTTSAGGVKLIYNGLPNASNSCTNTASSAYGVTDIGSSTFAGSSYNSPAYVGYMRGNTIYTTSGKNVRTSGYVFGNDVSWNGSTYTLVDTYTLGTWSSEYTKLAYNPDTGKGYHYTCGNTSTNCTSVYYLNYMTSSSSYVLTLTGGVEIEAAKTKMFSNETDSAIKGVIDSWYEDNLKNTAAENLLEDTVFCNDRTVYDGLLKSKNDTSAVNATTIYSYYGPYGRNVKNNKNSQTIAPSLQCPNVNDAFTVNAANGNGALDYPVGLLTEDELTLAGHGTSGYSSNSYLYTSRYSWSLSPYYFYNNSADGFFWYSRSLYNIVYSTYAVRPVVSLTPGTAVSDGDGSADRPWVIE